MDKRSDLVNSKPLEVCDSHANTEDDFEEYTEEEILSEEEPIEELSEEVSCGEKPDDEEDSDVGLDEASEEDSEDSSVEEIIEEDISEESEEEPKGKEPLSGSMDQLPLVNDSSLLRENNRSVVGVPRGSSKRRRSGWDLRVEDIMPVNGSGEQGKDRKTRWSSDIKAESSMLVNDNADHNKRRKTRWSQDEDPSNMSGIHMLQYSGHFQSMNAKLKLLNQKLDGSLVVNLKPKEPIPNQGRKKKKRRRPRHRFMFKKKLYLPLKEYPNYNFVGLIIGPNGNTVKKMEKETGANILLLGKGSVLKKRKSSNDQDDLHVMIEADSQVSFDAAVSMVEKLLVPVNDQQNYHKAAQLRELAEIKESQMDKTNADKNNPEKLIFPTRLFVGQVPFSVSTEKLKELFQPYGSLCFASVAVDKKTGKSKGYGFVKYTTFSDAVNAIEKMNGYMIDGKQLLVKIADKGNLLNFPGFASIPPTSSNTNQPSFPRLDPPSNANLPSFPGHDFIPPNAKLPSYPGYGVISPSFSNANQPSCPVLAPVPPSSLSANLPINFGLASIPSSSSANLPSYPGGAAASSSNSNLLSYPGLASIPSSTLNINLPSYPHHAALSPSSVNANLSTFLKPSLSPSSSMTKLQNYPGHVDVSPSSSTAKLPIYSGTAALTSSLSANLPRYATPTSVLPSSSNANLPSFPGFSAIQPSSNANFLSYPGLSAISQKIPEQNTWPGPPGSLLSESGISFFKSFDNSLSQTGRMPLQTSTSLGTTFQTSTALGTTFQNSSLGKNLCTMDGKKLEDTVTGIPPLSLNPSYLNYPGFTAISREIPEPNRATAVSSELASFPGYLKSLDAYPFDQSAPSSSLSSRPSYFTREFSGNQINPTLRNYKHTTSN